MGQEYLTPHPPTHPPTGGGERQFEHFTFHRKVFRVCFLLEFSLLCHNLTMVVTRASHPQLTADCSVKASATPCLRQRVMEAGALLIMGC